MHSRHLLVFAVVIAVSACEPPNRPPVDDRLCDTSELVCEGNSHCAVPRGQAVCRCDDGWSGEACDTCDPEVVDGCAAGIRVSPAVLSLEGAVGATLEAVVDLTNSGSAPLSFPEPPRLTPTGASHGNFELFAPLAFDCDGDERPDAAEALAPGQCARLSVRFTSDVQGTSTAILAIETNARDTPVMNVVITASTGVPQLELCLLNLQGEDERCWNPTDGLHWDVTVDGGDSASREFVMRSTGNVAVQVNGTLSGDPAFSMKPAEVASRISPEDEARFTITFAPTQDGEKESELVLVTTDPDAEEITVGLSGRREGSVNADGPRLCLCVAPPGASCTRATSTADFGKVPPAVRARRILHIGSCGTDELEIADLDLINDRSAFSAEWPTLPQRLAVGHRLEVELTFTPELKDQYAGRIEIESNSIGPRQHLALSGEGFEAHCELEAAPAELRFGGVAKGITARRTVQLTNVGTFDCLIPSTPTVTTLTGGVFSLRSGPAAPKTVAPGESVNFEVGFTPGTSSGSSTGQFEVDYEADHAGSTPEQLTIDLAGTATEVGPCKLAVQPDLAPGATGNRTLAFGNVRVGKEKTRAITIQNVGGEACTLTPASIRASAFPLPELDNSADFSITSQPTSPLPPGAQTTLDVRFAPSKEFEMPVGYESMVPSVRLPTSDLTSFPQGCPSGFPPVGSSGAVCWNLTGGGVRADILVVPNALRFGAVNLGCSSQEQVVRISNTGGDAIAVQATEIHPIAAAQRFFVEGGGTFTIPPGGQRDLRIRFVPPSSGPALNHDAVLRILSDATNEPQVDVALTASGTTQRSQTDTFTQPDGATADLLFVVDDSGSMSEEQSLLADNVEHFLQVAETLGTDFHVAVVTTDMSDTTRSGKFQGTPKVVTSATPNAATRLHDNIQALGVLGSGTEKGLQAMVTALSEPLLSNENAGFLRDDASLSVIVVSDEDDFSGGAVEVYVNFLSSIKGPNGATTPVKLHTIVGPAGGCHGANGDATAAPRYEAVRVATGGHFQSICEQDWGSIGEQIASDLLDDVRSLRLTRVLDANAAVTVKVNGTTAASGVWGYAPETNHIIFARGHVPAPGSTITVDYQAQCFAP